MQFSPSKQFWVDNEPCTECKNDDLRIIKNTDPKLEINFYDLMAFSQRKETIEKLQKFFDEGCGDHVHFNHPRPTVGRYSIGRYSVDSIDRHSIDSRSTYRPTLGKLQHTWETNSEISKLWSCQWKEDWYRKSHTISLAVIASSVNWTATPLQFFNKKFFFSPSLVVRRE